MTGIALFFLSLSTSAGLSAPECDQRSSLASSHLRRVRAAQNSTNLSAADEKCRLIFAQFVEAIAAHKTAETCQDETGRQSALKVIDAEMQALNERIAEQSCVQQ